MLFQQGVQVKTSVGLNVRSILKNVFDITDEFIERRISTILLDGKVVDDIDRAIIKEGSTLALSGAMPGLVGATMRTHSAYESFRRAITYQEKENFYPERIGLFTIKLFNVLTHELAPTLLKKGIILHTEQLKEMFLEKERILSKYLKKACIDNNEVKPTMLIHYDRYKGMCLMEIDFSEAENDS
ncbi:MAG: hypothetical protein N2596_06830 [Syntrophorhabdaceae bacterium]|nr:hypothetical protein [Syntrophorhabdaceae bacterium]